MTMIVDVPVDAVNQPIVTAVLNLECRPVHFGDHNRGNGVVAP
jgi:hypothetical protein